MRRSGWRKVLAATAAGGSIAAACGGQLSAEMDLEPISASSPEAGPDVARPSNDGATEASSPTGSLLVPPWTCAPTRALTFTDHIVETPTGPSRFNATCGSVVADGAEAVYSFKVTQRTGVRFTVTTSGTTPVIRILKACDPAATNTLCSDTWPTRSAGAALLQGVLDAGDYFVVIDQALVGAATTSAFTLDVSTFIPVANATCDGAITLLDTGTPRTGDVGTADAASSSCVVETAAGQLYYKVSVPPGRKWKCTATPSGSWKATISVREGSCATTACGEKVASTGDGAAVSVEVQNVITAPANKDFIVSVSSTDAVKAGAFTVSVTSSALAPCPVGAANGTPAGPGMHCCGGTAVSNTDPKTCGSSCSACPVPAHANATCDGTKCGIQCADLNWQDCNGSAADGCEANIMTDPTRCGGCTKAPCDPPAGGGGAAACSGGRCAISCTSPFTLCGAQCLNTLTDVNHCGGCTASQCASAGSGGTATCANGTCAISCQGPRYLACPGSATCVDTETDPANCGGCGQTCAVVAGVTSTCAGGCKYACADPNQCPVGGLGGDAVNGCQAATDFVCPGREGGGCGRCWEDWLGWRCNPGSGCCRSGVCRPPQ